MSSISIIIPTFKESRYVARTLDSVEKLEGKIEVILVETISEDTALLEHVIRKHHAVQLHKITKRGIARAKNRGAQKAQGNILLFLDADVFVTRDATKKVARVFKDSTVVGATCNNYPAEPTIGELLFFRFYNALIKLMLDLPLTRFKHSRGEFMAVRKTHFEKIGGFNERLACMEDADLAQRLSMVGRFVFIKDLVVYESMRRIRKLGLFGTFVLWFKNWLYYTIKNSVIAREWKPVR